MKSPSEDIQAIKQLAADWRSGWLANDVDTLLSLYAEKGSITLVQQTRVSPGSLVA